MKINGNLSWEKFMKTAVQMNSFDCEQFSYLCKSTGEVCEQATEFGYCKMTVCTKRYDNFLNDNIDDTSFIIPVEEQKYE